MFQQINRFLAILFLILYAYQIVFIFVALFHKRKKVEEIPIHNHSIAVLICARNEESVIGDLLENLSNQTYPKDRYTCFVLADNCTDKTAKIARRHSAIVYERQNPTLVGKGYALDELLQHTHQDYENVYDAYLILDADNLLEKDYLEQMNRSLCQGNKIITGYRNSKNYGSNWISAGYSLWFLRENRFLNYARDALGYSCSVTGTGFLFHKDILSSWDYHTLTEDVEFTIDQVCKNQKIAFCEKAVLYDEQPLSFQQSFDQRLRWAKGFLQVIRRYFQPLVQGVLRGSFSCFDMLNTITSAYGLSMLSCLIHIFSFGLLILAKQSLTPIFLTLGRSLLQGYLFLYMIGLLTTITEWNSIHTSTRKKILYTFTFPLFMGTYIPIAFYALFAKVSWKPIQHSIHSYHSQLF